MILAAGKRRKEILNSSDTNAP